MVHETKASEVPAIEEICRPGFSSSQHLDKPDSDGILHNCEANASNFSIVLEAKDDDIIDNAFNNKYVIQKGSSNFPQGHTAVIGHGTRSGASNEESEDVRRAFAGFLEEENSNLKGTNGEQSTFEGAMLKQDLDDNVLENYDGDAQYFSEVANQRPETGTPNSSSVSCGDTISDLTVTCDTVSNFSNASNEGTVNIFLEPAEVSMDCQPNDTLCSSESMLEYDVGNHHCNNMFVDSTYGSTANEASPEEASTEAATKPFNFFIRIPRFADESLREQIRIAKMNIEEKMKFMEAIHIQILEKRAENQMQGCDFKNAKIEHRKAWDLVTSKRMEIESVQSMINKAKNALSIQDIDTEIYNMEYMIQHETHTLKEEKQLLCGIRKLRQLRGELSSNSGSQDEIKQALEQREELEMRLKVLRKELDILKDGVRKAEAVVVKTAKEFEGGYKKIKELQTHFRAANEVRQVVYADLQSLRKELRQKNKHFFKYKDDVAAANTYASRRDEEVLYRLCMDQVENFMKHWNQNEEFRKEYVKFNTRSTVKRLGTLDGRSLGPNEEPLIVPSFAGGKVQTMLLKSAQIDDLNQETTVENSSTESDVNSMPMKKMMGKANQKKVTDKGQTAGNDFAAADDTVLEKSIEEIELARRAEENMRREEEAKLREQRRLEELVKANDARERKKRQAEKEQLRAQLKLLKEVELREKEREKKLRKKEKQKAAAPDVNDTHMKNGKDGAVPHSVVEMGQDKNSKDTVTSSETANKKPNKSWPFAKHSKSKSIPPQLRNRNKKYYRQWLLVAASCIAILVLFWLGNLGAFSKVNLKKHIPPP